MSSDAEGSGAASQDGGKGSDKLPPLREIIRAHGLSARKSLGQNFLLDLNITRKIARHAGRLDDHDIVEIGPGPGGLTRALLEEGARRVIAIEQDERLRPVMEEIAGAYPGRLVPVFDDARKIRPADLARPPFRIVANLPYNIGTALLVDWLRADWPPAWASLTLMFQSELAERIVARAGDRNWGRLAILANWRADCRIVYRIGREAFTPPPKVNSALLHIEPCAPKLDISLDALERLTAALFGKRRKMIRAALKALSPDAARMIEEAGIDPTRRAETLGLDEIGRLAHAFNL